MPTYDYRCQSCRALTTTRHGLTEDPQLNCPTCGSNEMVRIVGRVSVVMSIRDRARDVSWVDRNLAYRLRKQVSGALNPPLSDTLDRMETS